MVQVVEEAGNTRLAIALADGQVVEAVAYPRRRGAGAGPGGRTLCVSSQVGCGVGCPFCASGAFGLGRPLTVTELQAQVALAAETLGESPQGVTLSGVGEPLHNPATVEFFAWCRAQELPLSLTTSGGPLGRLREWMGRVHRGLTISVHAGTEEVRAQMVPGGPALGPLFDTLRRELPALTKKRRKRTALAYLVVAGRNDGDAEIDAFAARASEVDLGVHLYAFNPVPTSDERPVDDARFQQIYARLVAAGLRVRRSSQQRREPNGGCGTLVAELRRPRRRGSR